MGSGLRTFLSRKENIYLVLALSCGMVMAFINPPFDGVPDEHAHYWKAWAVAMGNIRCGAEDKIPKSAKYLPLNDFLVRVRIPGVGKKIVFNETMYKMFEPDTDNLAGGAIALCNTPPLGYLPQALGLRVGKLLHLSALACFYLARITNLIVAVLLIYLAIRIIPFGKIILLMIGLLPMTIQQCASINYDSLHIALCLVFTAYVVRLASVPDSPLHLREMSLLFLIGFLTFNVKYGFVGLGFLVFMLPVGRFGSSRRYWLFNLGFMVVNVLLFYLVYQYFQINFLLPNTSGGGGQPGVNISSQLLHVVNGPVQFIVDFFNTLYWGVHFYLETFLYKPGWLVKSLPPVWYVFLLAGMTVLVRNETEAVPLSRRQRYIVLAVFLANFTVVFFAMYLAWSKVGEGRIEGVQGRYLLGIAPLLVLFFYKAGFTFRHDFIRRHLSAILVAFYLAVFGGAFLSLHSIYYDKEPGAPLAGKILKKLF